MKARYLAEWSAVLAWNPEKRLSGDRSIDAAGGGEHGNVCEQTLGGLVIATSALRDAMHDIAAKKGDLTLFALFRRDRKSVV